MLNFKQLEAINSLDGAVMVMAGAGAGKTTVLTERFVNIVRKKNVDPSRILAVTFTNKASAEMKNRVLQNINIKNTNNLWISTFHSFCARLLRLEANNVIDYNGDFAIIDTDDSKKIIKEIMKAHPYDELISKDENKDEIKADFLDANAIQNAISKEKNGIVVQFRYEIDKMYFNFIKDLYQKELFKQNLMDFDDLILNSIKILKKYPEICNRYRNHFRYIEIDEFQDTNYYQYELIKLLVNDDNNIFVVGDDYQSIYSFRGAKIGNINEFRKDFKNHKLILLEENYRSNQGILSLANEVISKNVNQIKKTLFTSKKDDTLPTIETFDDDNKEIEYIISNIKKLKEENNYSWEDFAVLYRSNYLSRKLEQKLVDAGIPYCVFGGLSFFNRAEVKDMIAYLRLCVNHCDDFSFLRIVNYPKRGIGEKLIADLKAVASDKNISLFDAIDFFTPNKKGTKALIDFKQMILKMTTEMNEWGNNYGVIITRIFESSGMREKLKTEEEFDKIDNVLELATILIELKQSYPDLSNVDCIKEFLNNLALRTDEEKVDTKNKIRISTYHQVKGLEFENVFMMATSEGIFPNRVIVEDMEEERRICYVGITRAKKNLFITSADTRLYGGSAKNYLLSSFLVDINPSLFNSSIGRYEDGTINYSFKGKYNFNTNEQKSDDKSYEIYDCVRYEDKIGYVTEILDDKIIVNAQDEILIIAKDDVELRKL